MLASTEETRTFESLKADLLRRASGQFALVCGQQLLGVFASIDAALAAASAAFDAEAVPAGAPILISEIAERVSVRVMATPQQRSKAPLVPESLRSLA